MSSGTIHLVQEAGGRYLPYRHVLPSSAQIKDLSTPKPCCVLTHKDLK